MSSNIQIVVAASYAFCGGCSEGAVPGLDGGDWLEISSTNTEESNDTVLPTTQNDSNDLPSLDDDTTDSGSNDELPPGTGSINPDDSNDSIEDSNSTSTGNPNDSESTSSDPEESESTGSSTGSDADSDPESEETSSSSSDSEDSTEESESTSSSTSAESTSSDTSTSSTSDADEGDNEGTESTTGSDLDCDSFIEQEYLAVDAKYEGWSATTSNYTTEKNKVLRWFNSNGSVDFTIDIPCKDNWYIWVRGLDNFYHDAFNVQVDGKPSEPSKFEIDCTPTGNVYRWRQLHLKLPNSGDCVLEEDPWVQRWSPGDHHLIVYPETSPEFSRIIVSNNPDFVPSTL